MKEVFSRLRGDKVLVCPVEANEATLSLAFTLIPKAQFDQAGVPWSTCGRFLRCQEGYFVKFVGLQMKLVHKGDGSCG